MADVAFQEVSTILPTEPVVEVKTGYKIIECTDCGERRKDFKHSGICEDCWLALDAKKQAIRAACTKRRAKSK